jgi:hypothetical protein
MERQKQAVLYRKRHDAVRVRLAMRGQTDQLVRHVMSMPPKMRAGYFIRAGELQYYLAEITQLAQEFNISDPWNKDPKRFKA